MSEQDITRAIIATVNASGLARVWRTQSGQVKVRGAWMHLAPNGTADVVGSMLDGSARFLGIEVKKPKEHPTNVQIEWRKKVLESGGVAGVAHSVEEAMDIVRGAVGRAA